MANTTYDQLAVQLSMDNRTVETNLLATECGGCGELVQSLQGVLRIGMNASGATFAVALHHACAQVIGTIQGRAA